MILITFRPFSQQMELTKYYQDPLTLPIYYLPFFQILDAKLSGVATLTNL